MTRVVGDGLDLAEDVLLDAAGELMSSKDIARVLGLTRKYVTDHLTKQVGFPKPWARVTRKTVLWRREDIEKWMRRARRH
jgi:predicted DNA-binding transcriptional regulator AlpA